jgi:amino acid transporter
MLPWGIDAWIIGWALIMEYAIGNITVAISWVIILLDYWQWRNPLAAMGSNGLLDSHWIQRCNCLNAGWKTVWKSEGLKLSYTAWTTSPAIGSFHFVADLLALFIIILITALVYRGMKEPNASNVMVVVKLCIILLVIAVGVFYVDMDNWTPLRLTVWPEF